MRKKGFLAMIIMSLGLCIANDVYAQNPVVVQEDVLITQGVDCKSQYYSSYGSNWFIQLGAGVNVPFVENSLEKRDPKHHFTVGYNVAFGRWFSPYIGWRMSMLGGPIHWDNKTFSKAKYANANCDLMWDMFNTFAGVNTNRVFSVLPFAGFGGTFSWDYVASESNVMNKHEKIKRNVWTLPVSAGLQLRLRCCPYADFFVEGRAQFYGDNFNNCAWGAPIDVNITAIGGFTIYFGGAKYGTYNACEDLALIAALNNQVNNLRADAVAAAAALAACESQLPCPEVVAAEEIIIDNTELMAVVSFELNSDVVTEEEMVNVYNIAQWMNNNQNVNVVIQGYADRDTGTSEYNKVLSLARAEAVQSILVNRYGVNSNRLTVQAQGSEVQPYSTNSWNRVVIFAPNNN